MQSRAHQTQALLDRIERADERSMLRGHEIPLAPGTFINLVCFILNGKDGIVLPELYS